LRAVGALEPGSKDEVDTQGPEDVFSLPGGIFGKTECNRDIQAFSDQGVGDTGITAGGVKECPMAIEIPFLDGVADNIICSAPSRFRIAASIPV